MKKEPIRIKITVSDGDSDDQEDYQAEAKVEERPKLPKEQIQEFLKDCETQIEKISEIIENSDISVDVDKKIMDQTESFFDLVEGKFGSKIETYFDNEQTVRADFSLLINKSKVATDYYNIAQKLKAKGTCTRYHEEYLIFLKSYESGVVLKKVVNKYVYKRFAASLHKENTDDTEASSVLFSNFLVFLKNFSFIVNYSELNLSKAIKSVLASFDSCSDAKQKNNFYNKLKELYDRTCPLDSIKESKLFKSESNENIKTKMLDNLKLEVMQMQAAEDFKDIKKLLVPESQIEERMKLNMEQQTISWNYKKDSEYLNIYIVRKLFKFYIKSLKEESGKDNEEVLKKALDLEQQLNSFSSYMKEYAKDNSWHIITKKMKNMIDLGKFTRKQLYCLWDNQLFNNVYEENIKRLRNKDRDEAFSFIMNLVDVFCNIKEDEELKMFEKNFISHLKNVKEVEHLLKTGCLKDFKEYSFIVEHRLSKLGVHFSSYSLSETINKFLHKWIQALMD